MQLKGLPRIMIRGSRIRIPDLSPQGRHRLEALEMWRRTGHLQDVCEVFGVSRATLYRWRRRFDPEDVRSLEPRSRRPRRLRKPLWTIELVQAVRRLRRKYPRWGRAKLTVLLAVGRILEDLHRRGVLVDPPVRHRLRHGRPIRRPWAQRSPGGPSPPTRPGDLVELDTMQVVPVVGERLWQFTGRDVVSRWDVLEVHRRPTSCAAQLFLTTLLRRCPFPVRALQIDGGSEFKALFEQACQQLGLKLYLLPPRSPKLNGAVERANGTHRQEFYDVRPNLPWSPTAINEILLQWEHEYNHVRPHQALGYLTPAQVVAQHRNRGSPSHMS